MALARLIHTPINTTITETTPKKTIKLIDCGSDGGGMVNGVLVGRGVHVGALIRSSSCSGVDVAVGVLEGITVEV